MAVMAKEITMDKLREEFEEWAANDRSELDVWQRGNKVGEYKNPVVGKCGRHGRPAEQASWLSFHQNHFISGIMTC